VGRPSWVKPGKGKRNCCPKYSAIYDNKLRIPKCGSQVSVREKRTLRIPAFARTSPIQSTPAPTITNSNTPSLDASNPQRPACLLDFNQGLRRGRGREGCSRKGKDEPNGKTPSTIVAVMPVRLPYDTRVVPAHKNKICPKDSCGVSDQLHATYHC